LDQQIVYLEADLEAEDALIESSFVDPAKNKKPSLVYECSISTLGRVGG